jgi:DNA-binding winged helix-turn-helix (wHTH) protein
MQFLFGDCALDADRRELRRGADLVQVEPQVFDLLVHLLRNRDRVVSKDDLVAAVWQGRTVSDSTLSTRITAARRAIGDSGETQQLIRTVARRGVRFVGDVREEAAGAASSPSTPVRPSPNRAPHQDVTFCRTADGVSLAVATSGSGPPLVKASHWLNHIEHEWQSPVWSPLFVRLAAKSRLIRYDGRATGLSDYNVSDLSFDACVRDLETVVDALGLQRFALLGIAQGAPVSVAYAARHPERVSRLMLYGGFALGWLRWPTFSDPVGPASREAIVALMRDGWIPNNPGFRRFFNLLFVPDASEVELNWLDDYNARGGCRRI